MGKEGKLRREERKFETLNKEANQVNTHIFI